MQQTFTQPPKWLITAYGSISAAKNHGWSFCDIAQRWEFRLKKSEGFR